MRSERGGPGSYLLVTMRSVTPNPIVRPKLLDRPLALRARRLLVLLLVASMVAGAFVVVPVLWTDPDSIEVPEEVEIVETDSETALPIDELPEFEGTLVPKERELISEWGGDEESYHEYKLAAADNETYLRGSLAYFLMTKCRAASPDLVYQRMIQPCLRGSVDASTKRSVDEQLQLFAAEFNRHRQRLKREHGIGPEVSDSMAERTAYEQRYKAMWEAMDGSLSSITCERQLQELLGPPSKGTAYLALGEAR
jgi:hypothetical protein